MVMAVIDSHRQVAPSVATGTWTRVSLTYSNNKDRLCRCVNVALSHVLLLFSLFVVSQ